LTSLPFAARPATENAASAARLSAAADFLKVIEDPSRLEFGAASYKKMARDY
jgi:hypothetical protein